MRGLGHRPPGWRARRGAGEAGGTLPFLDIIFTTIGIFVVVFAIRVVAIVPESLRPVPDVLIGCSASPPVFRIWPERAAPPAEVPDYALASVIDTLLGEAGGAVTLLFAFDADCLGGRRTLMQQLRRVTEAGGPTVRYVERPLDPAPGVLERLVERWRADAR